MDHRLVNMQPEKHHLTFSFVRVPFQYLPLRLLAQFRIGAEQSLVLLR